MKVDIEILLGHAIKICSIAKPLVVRVDNLAKWKVEEYEPNQLLVYSSFNDFKFYIHENGDVEVWLDEEGMDYSEPTRNMVDIVQYYEENNWLET